MIICPNCGNAEMPGALFCKECGTQLADTGRDPTLTIPSSIADQLHKEKTDQDEQSVPPTPDDARLSLFLVDTLLVDHLRTNQFCLMLIWHDTMRMILVFLVYMLPLR